jgi:hypothetical protein
MIPKAIGFIHDGKCLPRSTRTKDIICDVLRPIIVAPRDFVFSIKFAEPT